MVIGFDGSRVFNKEKTGTENYSYQLLKNLAKIDTKNNYLVYIRASKEILNQVQDDKQNWPKNFEFITISLPRFWTQVGLAIHTFTDNLDILFTPAHTLPIVRKPRLNSVMTVHDLGSEYLPGMHQLKQRLYLNFIINFQLNSTTKLIAVSKATKKDLTIKAGIDPKKIKVIYEGVDREFFKPIKNDALVNSLRQFNLEKKKYFLFVGTIQPRKNLKRLINAYDSIYGPADNPPKLVLAGSKGWLSDDIYDLVRTLDLEDKVLFLGRVEDKDLPALYSGAIALVFPSLFEGFGLPILEAMACGCPVITSNLSSMPEVAGKAAILVNPFKIKEISTAMLKIAKDDTLKDILIEKGNKQVRKFNWQTTAKQTLNLFNTL